MRRGMFLGDRHARCPKESGPVLSNFLASPTYAPWYDNKMLHGDQARWDENFYTVNHSSSLAKIFHDTNADVWSVCGN